MELKRIRLSNLHRLHSQALARLTLRTFGEVHRIFLPAQQWLVGQVAAGADDKGDVEPLRLMGVASQFALHWKAAVERYAALLDAAREQAASLPYGALVVEHNAMMAGGRRPVQEQMSPDETAEILRLWRRRRDLALEATRTRVYGDGLQMSQRIWRGIGSTERVRAVLAAGMSERTNAWALARQLEQDLGFDERYPRWTSSRLYRMTPSERRRSEDGLWRFDDLVRDAERTGDATVMGRGVAYNALRLARNELQHANHAVATEIATHNPAVTGRRTVLSPGHPQVDICDEWAAGGPYEKTLEILPLHPQCMCVYKDVLMDHSEFTRQVRGWMAGENDFLDDYSRWMGTRQVTEPLAWTMPIAETLQVWLSMAQDTQALALHVAR